MIVRPHCTIVSAGVLVSSFVYIALKGRKREKHNKNKSEVLNLRNSEFKARRVYIFHRVDQKENCVRNNFSID